MTRLWFGGAEFNDTQAGAVSPLEGVTFGNVFAYQTSVVRSGIYAFQNGSGSGNVASTCTVSFTGANGTTYYGRVYLNLPALPTTTTTVSAFQTGGSVAQVSARLTSGGKIQLWDDLLNLQIGSDSTVTLAVNTWYCVELSVNLTAALLLTAECRLEYASIASGSATVGSATAPGQFVWGWVTAPGANLTVYSDDAALNDSAGANQNSWPGSGKVVLLVPTATSAAAAKWTDNDGTQTNMWSGVDNRPPVGIAAATSPSHAYVKHAGGGAASPGDAFDATMTSYTAAGMGASDTVTLIQYCVVTGEESATGTKLLALAGVSNPVVAQGSAFDVFATSGVQGTYGSNWTIKKDALAIQYGPAVTPGTAPVMRVARPETATRVASVCFMGMLVEYVSQYPTEFGSRPYGIVGRQQMHQLLAQ